MSNSAAPIRLAFLAASLACLASCQTTVTTDDGRPMPPPPRPAPPTPDQAPVNAMAIVLGPKPTDTNGNMRPDTIQLEAYLFARPYPTPTWRDGVFEFSIYPPGKAGSPDQPAKDPIRTWSILPEQAAQSRTHSLIGDGYALELSLLTNGGTDLIGYGSVDLIARFIETGSETPVSATGVRSVSLASPMLAPGR
ncbi:MAG: hypothetical protein U0572_07370 [Phycisphaerales bacterium]